MTEDLLPSSRHASDLIEFAQELLERGTERDIKIALILADNAVETLLKEHSRYAKNKRVDDVIQMPFHKLLDECEDIDIVQDKRNMFTFYHDMRNTVYHFGILVPPKRDVESSIGMAELLFNALNPAYPLVKTKVQLPSKEVVEATTKSLPSKNDSSIRAVVELEEKFKEYLGNRGFSVLDVQDQEFLDIDIVAERAERRVLIVFRITAESVYYHRNGLLRFNDAFLLYNSRYSSGKLIDAVFVVNTKIAQNVKMDAANRGIHVIENGDVEQLEGFLK